MGEAATAEPEPPRLGPDNGDELLNAEIERVSSLYRAVQERQMREMLELSHADRNTSEKEIKELNETLSHLREEQKVLQMKRTQASKDCAEQKAQVEELRKLLDESDMDNAEKRARLNELRGEVDTLKNADRLRQDEIASLKARLEDGQVQSEEKSRQIERLKLKLEVEQRARKQAEEALAEPVSELTQGRMWRKRPSSAEEDEEGPSSAVETTQELDDADSTEGGNMSSSMPESNQPRRESEGSEGPVGSERALTLRHRPRSRDVMTVSNTQYSPLFKTFKCSRLVVDQEMTAYKLEGRAMVAAMP